RGRAGGRAVRGDRRTNGVRDVFRGGALPGGSVDAGEDGGLGAPARRAGGGGRGGADPTGGELVAVHGGGGTGAVGAGAGAVGDRGRGVAGAAANYPTRRGPGVVFGREGAVRATAER